MALNDWYQFLYLLNVYTLAFSAGPYLLSTRFESHHWDLQSDKPGNSSDLHCIYKCRLIGTSVDGFTVYNIIESASDAGQGHSVTINHVSMYIGESQE